MNIEDIRQKYQCDASQTFAQWKEWVRKTKPSQAQAHIVKAVAPNGSKYERLIGGYTDAQNVAFDLVSHGYKDVKLYHSVNAGPLKLLRNFSSPLHGAKFKDSCDSVDEIRNKYTKDGFLNVDKETRRKIISYLKTRWKLDDAKTNRFIRDFDRDLGDLVKDKEPWDRITKFIDGRVKKIDVNPYSNSYGHSLIAQKYKKPGKDKLRSKDSADAVDSIREKYAMDETNDQPNKKRYEVHYQATAPDGHIYGFIKEAVCTPAQLRGIMKKVEEEQKKKGVTLKKMFTRTVY